MDIEIAMTDEIRPTQIKNNSTLKDKTGIGLRLKEAREAIGLSEKEAALHLHLNVKFIALMENEDLKGTLPVTFVRGYLRSYARLLNVDEKEVNAALEALGMNFTTPSTPAFPTQHTPIHGPNRGERYVRSLTYLIALLLLVLVGFWWNSHSRDTIMEAPAPAKTSTTTPTAAPLTTPIALPPTAQASIPSAPIPAPATATPPALQNPSASLATPEETKTAPLPAPKPKPAISQKKSAEEDLEQLNLAPEDTDGNSATHAEHTSPEANTADSNEVNNENNSDEYNNY